MNGSWERDLVDLDQELKDTVLAIPSPRYPLDAWALLQERFSASRRLRMVEAAAQRTRFLRLVVQDVYQPHNVSACIRTADAFGVQDIDVVTMRQKFKASTVAKGVSHWLTIRRHHSVSACVQGLRSQGFRIAAALPRQDATPLYDLKMDQPLCVVFGNEHSGLHRDWLPHIDEAFTIPMTGMVESLNISVSCAITLAYLTRTLKAQLGDRYYLDAETQQKLLCEWACRQIPSWASELDRLRKQKELKI